MGERCTTVPNALEGTGESTHFTHSDQCRQSHRWEELQGLRSPRTRSTVLRPSWHMTARGAGVGAAAERSGGRGGAREGASAEAASDRGMRHDVSTTTCSVQHASCSSSIRRATYSTRRVMYMFNMLNMVHGCMLHARMLHCCTLALLHITRGFSMQDERAKVNASIAEPQTRLSERALPSMAPVRAAAPRACCTAISRCPSHDESPRSAAAPPSGRRACPRVACGPCAQVTATAADCGALCSASLRGK